MGSSFVSLLYASHLGYVSRNRHLESIHLTSAMRRDPPIDVRWFIFKRRRELEEVDMKTGQGGMNVMRRMQFEQLTNICASLAITSRQHILAFWTELNETRPSHARVERQGMLISTVLKSADMGYQCLMELASNNAAVMREYGGFLLEVANEPVRAAELLSDADMLEEEQSRSHVEGAGDIVFFSPTTPFSDTSETAAVVRVSSDPSTVGLITHTNPVALRLFGYNKREILGRDVSVLLPEPISSVHSTFLKSFLRDGKIRVINTTRIMFGVHRAGHIFAMRGNIRPLEDGFVGVFELINTPQCFIIFNGGAGNWRVLAACATTITSLALDPLDMRNGGYSIKSLLPGIETPICMEGLKADSGRIISLVVGVRCKDEVEQLPAIGSGLEGAEVFATSAINGAATATAATAMAKRTIQATAHLQEFHLPILSRGPMYILRWQPKLLKGQKAWERGGGLSSGKGSGSSSGSESGSGSSSGSGGGSDDDSLASFSGSESSGGSSSSGEEDGEEGDAGSTASSSNLSAKSLEMTSAVAAAAAAAAAASSAKKKGVFLSPENILAQTVSSTTTYPSAAPSLSGGMPETAPSSAAKESAAAAPIGAKSALKRTFPSASKGSAVKSATAAGRAFNGGEKASTITPARPLRRVGFNVPESGADSGVGFAAAAMGPLVGTAPPATLIGGGQQRGGMSGGMGGAMQPTLGMNMVAAVPPPSPGGFIPTPLPYQPAVTIAARTTIRTAPTSPPLSIPMLSPAAVSAASAASAGSSVDVDESDVGSVLALAASANGVLGLSMAPSADVLEAIAAAHEGHKLISTSPRIGNALHHPIHHGHHSSHQHQPHHGGEQHQHHPHHGGHHEQHLRHPHRGGEQHQHHPHHGGHHEQHQHHPHHGGHHEQHLHHPHLDGEQHQHHPHHGGSHEPLHQDHHQLPQAVQVGSPFKGSPRKEMKAISSAGSVASGRSGMSSSRGGASVAAVLRSMISEGVSAMEPSLVALRRALLMIFLVTAVMNLVALAMVRVQFTELAHNIATTASHGDLAMALQGLFTAVQLLAFASEGLYPLMPGEEGVLRGQLRLAIDKFSTLHYSLFQEQSFGRSTLDEHNLYVNAAIIVNDLQPGTYINSGTYITTNRTVNLLNAGVELASQATVVYNLPFSNITHANVYVFWVLFNGAGMRHPHDFLLIPLSTTFADKRSSGTAAVVVAVTWAVMAVALFMFTAIGVVILTRVQSVLRNKVAIFDVFLSVPQVVVRSMRTLTGMQLEASLRNKAVAEGGAISAEDDEDAGVDALINEDDMNIDWSAFSGLLQATGSSKLSSDEALANNSNDPSSVTSTAGSSSSALNKLSASASAATSPPPNFFSRLCTSTWTLLFCCCRSSTLPTPISSSSIQTNKNRIKMNKRLMKSPPWAMTVRLLAPLMVPILLMVSYYAGRTIWTLQTNSNLGQKKAEAMAAKMVEFSVAQLGFFTRDLASSCIPSRISYFAGHMQQDITYVQITNDRLLYGDDGLRVPKNAPGCPWTGCPDVTAFTSALRNHPTINKLFLQDGCIVFSNDAKALLDCKAFFDGMLGNGVQGFFQQLMVIVQQLVVERTAYGIAMTSNANLTKACRPSNLRIDPDPRIFLVQTFVETYMSPVYSFGSSVYKVSPFSLSFSPFTSPPPLSRSLTLTLSSFCPP